MSPTDTSLFTAPLMTRKNPVIYTHIESGRGDKEYITEFLLNALEKTNTQKKGSPFTGKFHLEKDGLGRSRITFPDFPKQPGPAVSFTRGRSRLWAAMVRTHGVGIDIAFPEEFYGNYPLHRAFMPWELHCVHELTGGSRSQEAALIWSLKEAAAKALGWGFNLIDPLDIRVTNGPEPSAEGVFFEVRSVQSHPAWARRHGEGWLSLALSR